MTWWRRLGFKSNPLSIRPNKNLLGLEDIEKRVLFLLSSGIPALLFGDVGTGKTSLALRIMDKLKKKYLTVYLNGEEAPRDLSSFIEKKRKKFWFWRDKRDVIFLIDEAEKCERSFFEKLKNLFDKKEIYSFLLIQVSEKNENFSKAFLDRLSIEKFKLKPPSTSILKEIIRRRLQGKIIFDERGVEKVALICGNNVRKVLKTLLYIMSKVGIKEFYSYEDIINNLPTPTELGKEKIHLSKQQKIIARSLLEGEKTLKELEEELGIKKEILSKQLARMIDKGCVIKRKEGKQVLYSIKEEAREVIEL